MSGMTCEAFERWLDAGADSVLAAEASAHAASCARCAAAHAAMRELDALLESAPAAPAGFADRVMHRVAAAEAARAARPAWLTLPDDMPWWVTATAQPATALACVVAALVLWRGQALLAAGAGAVAATGPAWSLVSSWAQDSAAALSAALTGVNPSVLLALALGFAPLVFMFSVQLERWCERLAQG
jgi:hypothetical protein